MELPRTSDVLGLSVVAHEVVAKPDRTVLAMDLGFRLPSLSKLGAEQPRGAFLESVSDVASLARWMRRRLGRGTADCSTGRYES
jgi:hypothetical protein